jgi:hypothetical protein
MARTRWALGAVIVHQYYPGFIDLPPIPTTGGFADAQGLVLLSAMCVSVVVDFNNSWSIDRTSTASTDIGGGPHQPRRILGRWPRT